MNIAIACHAGVGGSGIIATEVGFALASRGHNVHFVSARAPWRWSGGHPNVTFHDVPALASSAFGDSGLAMLGARLAEVARLHALDFVWAHYALPHAVALYLVRELLAPRVKKLVTLHGTDVTLAGKDATFAPLLSRCLAVMDGLTVPSEFLRQAAEDTFGVRGVRVIANFVDTDHFVPAPGPRSPVLVHASNFRAVKRVTDVVRIFARIRSQRPARLVLAGDGEERAAAEALASELSVRDDTTFLGGVHDLASLLGGARVFLLPSEVESFGLAALEAQSAGVPVIAGNVGGVGEVVRHGETGFLFPPGDIASMAEAALRLLNDDVLFAEQSKAARDNAVLRFAKTQQVDAYARFLETI